MCHHPSTFSFPGLRGFKHCSSFVALQRPSNHTMPSRRGAESSRRKGLLDQDVDITSYLEYVLRMRKGWRFTGVTIYCKRPSNSLGKPWPQAAWPQRNCGAKRPLLNKRSKMLNRRWRACNKRFRAFEPSINKPSNS